MALWTVLTGIYHRMMWCRLCVHVLGEGGCARGWVWNARALMHACRVGRADLVGVTVEVAIGAFFYE